MPNVNFLSVILAAIAGLGIGAAWYSPALFGRQWMALMGLSPEALSEGKEKMGRSYVMAFVSVLVMAYVLSHIMFFMGAASILEAVQIGGWMWLGFIVPVHLSGVLWEKKPW